jgi:hypothetical protein
MVCLGGEESHSLVGAGMVLVRTLFIDVGRSC